MTTTPALSTLPETIAARTAEAPDAHAVCADSNSLTYREMDREANRLARKLRSRGAGKETLVGVCLPRSLEMVVSMLAIWKTGAAYVPLDPGNPPDRLATIVEDAQIAILVCTPEIERRLAKTACQFVDPTLTRSSEPPVEAPAAETEPGDLAYVIYTSGSTGVPKGVEITHAGLWNLVAWHNRAFSVTAADRASHLAGLAFDASGWELWPYLAAGASVHLVDDVTRNSAELLRDWLLAKRISVSFVPTPLAERLLFLEWPADTALRLLLTGGDTLHHYPPEGLPFELVNNYGPTECTVVATSGIVPPAKGPTALPAIGRAIDHTQIYILDENLKPVAAGTPGEICIAGANLARGYRNLPNLTLEKFVSNPSVLGGRMYRTGDLGLLLPDGQIEYRGRLDDQIKIRGYRIEPSEIISRLNRHPQVRESLVMAREDAGGKKRLVAYVVFKAGSHCDEIELIGFLRESLPDYMIPTAFIRLEALPLTPNGKIDRAALPAPDFEGERTVQSPRTPVEQSISGILADLLKLPNVGRDDNFFLLGGHSLLGAQLIARIKKTFGVEISLRALFEAPTIAALSAEIENRAAPGCAHLSSASALS